MANNAFTSLNSLIAYLQPILNEVLVEDVSPVICDEIESSAIEVVLGAGQPIYYNRRSSSNSLNSGGIADKAEMETTLIENGVIEVIDNASPSSPWNNGRSLAENLEYGYNGMDTWYNQPRPFIKQSKENLQESKNHVHALADGLRKRGFTVIE